MTSTNSIPNGPSSGSTRHRWKWAITIIPLFAAAAVASIVITKRPPKRSAVTNPATGDSTRAIACPATGATMTVSQTGNRLPSSSTVNSGVTQLIRDHTGEARLGEPAESAAETCGSCGMTQAEMAAGACGHEH